MRLEGKNVVVTGGASGIGGAGAVCCAGEGAQVAVVDLDRKGVDRIVKEIEEAGGTARGYVVDVREEEQVRDAFSAIETDFERVDGLIHSAGILEGAFVPVEEFEEFTWDRVLDINLKGSFLVSKYAVPLLEQTGKGVLVLIASGAGVRGGSSSIAYGSSKGGVHGLSLVLASQLAKRNIRVHGVCPGGIETPLKMRVVEKQAKAAGREVKQMSANLGSPEGVGKILSFLVSEESDYLRGTVFTR